jgi:hypothetical protein
MITSLENATRGLAHFLYSGTQERLEPIRLARAGYALLTSGCSVKGYFLGHSLSEYLINSQRQDGGWTDVEETLWCLGYLSAFGKRYHKEAVSGKKWLSSVRLPCGAWGRNERDQPRIPITALAAYLLRDIDDGRATEWLACQWEADMANPTQLTYKGAFFLLSKNHVGTTGVDVLVERTLQYLCEEQEENGGFGPWKGHPVGSEPWSTGVVLWALSGFYSRVPPYVIERALLWLQSKQLPNGLWPYHYLDDGTAMALIGIASVLQHLSER